MRRWLSPYFTLLAIVALFASAMPSLVWSCPMTGRVGTADKVCRMMGSGKMASCHCARPGSKCCQQVPTPKSDTNNQSDNDTSVIYSGNATVTLLTQLSQTVNTPQIIATLPPPPLRIMPPSGFSFDKTVSSSFLAAQHAPPAFQGRAPPTI